MNTKFYSFFLHFHFCLPFSPFFYSDEKKSKYAIIIIRAAPALAKADKEGIWMEDLCIELLLWVYQINFFHNNYSSSSSPRPTVVSERRKSNFLYSSFIFQYYESEEEEEGEWMKEGALIPSFLVNTFLCSSCFIFSRKRNLWVILLSALV